jgi:hypothetical protein
MSSKNLVTFEKASYFLLFLSKKLDEKKNLHKNKSEKLLQKLVEETPFSFLHYKIALKLKLQ